VNTAPLTSSELLKAAKSFHTKKQLGQHLLVDSAALQDIAESLQVCPGDTIVEIGCGTGFLTRHLNTYGVPVVAIDLDRESTATVDGLGLANVRVVHGDFLNFNLSKLMLKRHEADDSDNLAPAANLRVVGNVPYQITGLIIGHVLGEIGEPAPWFSSIRKIVLTVQYEVALRMVSKPSSKDYSKLSLMMQYFGKANLVKHLDPEQFFPPPEVTSAIVTIEPSSTLLVSCSNHLLLRRVINAGFAGRRKMLRNALTSLGFKLDLNQLFRTVNLDPQARAENLSLETFAALTNAIEEQIKT
jgi:16S rRNA (adenine1518-N6/adenine1519-N6)-dimethyltransferase